MCRSDLVQLDRGPNSIHGTVKINNLNWYNSNAKKKKYETKGRTGRKKQSERQDKRVDKWGKRGVGLYFERCVENSGLIQKMKKPLGQKEKPTTPQTNNPHTVTHISRGRRQRKMQIQGKEANDSKGKGVRILSQEGRKRGKRGGRCVYESAGLSACRASWGGGTVDPYYLLK